jgi:protein phosphatase PTC6
MTVVRIPIKSAKHHFGVSFSRGQRPYNEDTFQAGTIEIPAFAKRRPRSLTRNPDRNLAGTGTSADSASGDPQVFYFGVFDGHGGSECSDFLRDELHEYIEDGAKEFELQSTLKRKKGEITQFGQSALKNETEELGNESRSPLKDAIHPLKPPDKDAGEKPPSGLDAQTSPPTSSAPLRMSDNLSKAEELERSLVRSWKQLVGGYFRRFKPEYFCANAGGKGHLLNPESSIQSDQPKCHDGIAVGIESVLEYSFLKADYDFVSAQVSKPDDDTASDRAINADEILGKPWWTVKRIGGPKRFKGGSTCSVALISTPTPTPFWHPASPSTLITSHVGDTRILLCETATGKAVPMTSNHHPSHPREAERMRRYAATFVTDSFGEERVLGLANTRAFGDMASKRYGVSAEPEICRIELGPAEYAFIVLVSDGVSGPLSDQEIVDIVKEARTPEQGAKDVVNFATEVTTEGDNATALVVRLGGWERRSECGLGSLGTKELRDWRRQEALDPRSRQR